MLVNGVLYNSEAWHSVTSSDITPLEKIDETLLRFILDAHSKAPLETLYLETGAIPMRFIIASRRMNYLQTILKRDENELTKRVLMAQFKYKCEGDYAELVKNDFETMNIPFDIMAVKNCGVQTYKSEIKEKIREAAFKYLQNKQENHSKVKNIKYERLETQQYLTSHMFKNHETSLLYALRTRTSRLFRANFRFLYNGNIECPLNCWDVNFNEPAPPDTQEHLLWCNKINLSTNIIARNKSEYEDIFRDMYKQKEIISLYTKLIDLRENLMKKESNPPGDKLDPSSSTRVCCDSILFTSSIDDTIIGNK